jgi:hypothetical protein
MGCGSGSSSSAEKKGGKEKGPRLGLILNRTGPSFVEVMRSDLGLVASVLPIVGGRHSKMWAPLAKPCTLDILPVVRSADLKVLRSAMDCFVLELPLLDPLAR